MNDKKRGGFIQLIAAIIIGVVALAGGTVVTISIIKSKEHPTPTPIVEPTDQAKTKQKNEEVVEPKEFSVAPNTPATGSTPKQGVVSNSARGTESAYQALIHPDRPTQEEEIWDTSLLREFITNPTLSGYAELCSRGLSIIVPLKKEVLSSDRTTMEMVPTTIADILQCDLVKNADYQAISIGPEFMQWDFSADDTYVIRQEKIYYAQNLKEATGNSKIALVYPKTEIGKVINATTQHIEPGLMTDTTFHVIPLDNCAKQLVEDPSSIKQWQISACYRGYSFRVHGSERP